MLLHKYQLAKVRQGFHCNEKLSASYTAGGMTISATMAEGDNINHSNASNEDLEYWALGASFAF